MPALIVFIAVFTLALFAGAILAYPIYDLLSNWFEMEFERVVSRCVVLTVIILFILLFRRLGFHSWRDIGYNTNQKEFWISLIKGFGLGILIMLPVIAGLLITQNRIIDFGWDWSLLNILSLIIVALLAGITIALIEETLFRGAMLTAIQRKASNLFAIVSTSFVYAFVHFLQPETHINSDLLNWNSGITVIKNAFMPLLQPVQYIDSFIALFLAGILLALVKMRTHMLVICIGIHTGWVFVIKIFKRLTNSNISSDFTFLAGSYDKVIGYLAAFCIAIAILLYLRTKKSVPG